MFSKYKDAAEIAHRVLEAVIKLAVDGATVLSLCQEGDKLLDEETQKVYKGKKISKGMTLIVVVLFHLLFDELCWILGICQNLRVLLALVFRRESFWQLLEFSLITRFNRNCLPHHCFA